MSDQHKVFPWTMYVLCLPCRPSWWERTFRVGPRGVLAMLFNTRDGFLKRIVATARELSGPTLPQVRGVRVRTRIRFILRVMAKVRRHDNAPQRSRIVVHWQATAGPGNSDTVLCQGWHLGCEVIRYEPVRWA